MRKYGKLHAFFVCEYDQCLYLTSHILFSPSVQQNPPKKLGKPAFHAQNLRLPLANSNSSCTWPPQWDHAGQAWLVFGAIHEITIRAWVFNAWQSRAVHCQQKSFARPMFSLYLSNVRLYARSYYVYYTNRLYSLASCSNIYNRPYYIYMYYY